MSVKLNINNKTAILENPLKVQFMPAAIHGSCKANLATYFDPYTVEEGKILSNSLRGYPLKGEKLDLDDRFVGICARDGIGMNDENSTKIIKAFGSFNALTYWNYDSIPSKSDPLKQAFQMFDVLDKISDISTEEIQDEMKKHN